MVVAGFALACPPCVGGVTVSSHKGRHQIFSLFVEQTPEFGV